MSKIKELTEQNYQETIAATEGTVIVDFWAPWCGPCKTLLSIVDTIESDLKEGQTIFKMDIDNASRDFLVEMGVRSVPTLITYKNGEKTGVESGIKTKEELLEMLS